MEATASRIADNGKDAAPRGANQPAIPHITVTEDLYTRAEPQLSELSHPVRQSPRRSRYRLSAPASITAECKPLGFPTDS